MPAYISAQVFGSTLASVTLRLLLNIKQEHYFGTVPTVSNLQSLALEIIISFTLMFVISGVATDNRAVSFFQELRSSFIRPGPTPNSTQNLRVWVDRVYFVVGLRLTFLVRPINKSTFIAFLILCNLPSSFHKQIRIPSSKFVRPFNRIH